MLSASSCVLWEKSWVDQGRGGDHVDCIKGGNLQLEDGYDGQSSLVKFFLCRLDNGPDQS